MKRNVRIVVRIIAVNDMICWKTWNYLAAARFEIGCLWHNLRNL